MSRQPWPADADACASAGARVAAAGTHGSAVLAAGVAGLAAHRPLLWAAALAFLGPLSLWIVLRHARPFVARHARQALAFNLSVAIYVAALFAAFAAVGVAGALLTLVPVFLFAVLVLVVNWVVLTVVAIGRALRGEPMDYPFVLRGPWRR
jgi:uncharacterized Tic20 family protein